jgi:hypothetical protein
MRLALLACLASGAVLLGATAAGAANLISATWIQSLQGVNVTVTNSGTTCTSTGANLIQQTITCPTGSGLNPTGTYYRDAGFSVSLTLPAFALTQYTTGGAIDVRTRASIRGGDVTFTGNVSAAVANAGISGRVTVNVAAHVDKGVNASLLTRAPTTLVVVPLSIGKADTFTGYFYLRPPGQSPQLHYMTVDFYAWTPHTLTFTGLTSKGAPLPDVVAMGSLETVLPNPSEVPRSSFAWGEIALTLVSPSKISIDGPLAQRRTASFTSLRITFIDDNLFVHGTPEPGTLLLLGAGAAGLLLARRRAQ